MPKNSLRPVPYFGGKHEIAEFIIARFQPHECYGEGFGGGGGVLFSKDRSLLEVYNDLDDEIVNLYRVMRDPIEAEELMRLVELTPFSRVEYDIAHQQVTEPVERARRTLIKAWMGFARCGASSKWRTGFGYGKTRATGNKARQWAKLPSVLDAVLQRLQGVLIENLPIGEFMKKLDGPKTLFYLDPPYPQDDRPKSRGVYRKNMSVAEHCVFAKQVHDLNGMVLVSGYPGLYSELFSDWRCVTIRNHTSSASARQEILWLSPNIKKGLFDAI